jgi:hypothetical protein
MIGVGGYQAQPRNKGIGLGMKIEEGSYRRHVMIERSCPASSPKGRWWRRRGVSMD